MKTPEEIIKALECCSKSEDCIDCMDLECPYVIRDRYDCTNRMAADVLKYIEIINDYNHEIFERMPKWISVKDRLPEEGSLCCAVSDGDICVSYWHTGEGGRWFYTNGEYDCNVTHWMLLPPLPDLPREDCNE